MLRSVRRGLFTVFSTLFPKSGCSFNDAFVQLLPRKTIKCGVKQPQVSDESMRSETTSGRNKPKLYS